MSIKTALVAFLLLLAPAQLSARSAGLTVKPGETWIFSLSGGQPARARKARPTEEPDRGEVRVTVNAMMGTTMTITNNNPVSYVYRADLLGTGKAKVGRSCTLPANGRLAMENWPQKASAVRLSNFKRARSDGSCP